MWILLGIIAWLWIGFVGRCMFKHWVFAEFDGWDSEGKRISYLITLAGPLGAISNIMAILSFDDNFNLSTGEEYNKWGFML